MTPWQMLIGALITGIVSMLVWFIRRGISRNDANHERSQVAIQALGLEVKGMAVAMERGYVTGTQLTVSVAMQDAKLNSTRDEIYSHMDSVEGRLAADHKALSEKLDRHIELDIKRG